MTPLHLSHFTASSCLGHGLEATLSALRQHRGGLAPCHFETARDLDTYIGEVAKVDDASLPAPLAEYECRNNRLAFLGLRQYRRHFADRAGLSPSRSGQRRPAGIKRAESNGPGSQ